MLKDYRFHFRPVLTVLSVLALGVLIALGSWQLQRLEWKRGLIAKVEARVEAAPIPFEEALALAEAGEDMEYTPVKLNGRFHYNKRADIFGSYDGVPGVFVFTPVGADFGEFIYVNRGFVSQDARKAGWPETRPSETPITEITGLFRSAEKPVPPASWFRSSKKSADGLWFVRDPLTFAADAGIEAPAFYIDQFAVPGREWPRGGTTRLDFNNRHLEYALTWFGLALTLLGVCIAFFLQKR